MSEKIYKYYDWKYIVYSNGEIFDCKKGDYLHKIKESNGYYVVYLGYGDLRKRKYLHRIVAEVFIENTYNIPISELTVNHKNYDKLNNNIENLEWMTREENARHSYLQSNHHNVGEYNKNSKLTHKDVKKIKSILNEYNDFEIANMFNVNQRTIYDIRHNKTWKRVI